MCWRVRLVDRGRKAHVCDLCGGPIPAEGASVVSVHIPGNCGVTGYDHRRGYDVDADCETASVT